MASEAGRVSIVIASKVGAPFIDDCLTSLEQQARDWSAEVIVVACGDAEFADRIARTFPWVHVLHRPARETVPDLRRHGVDAASGEVVAVIEEHCLAAPDWLTRALEAHAGGEYGVVGGPVVDHAYTRLRDWTVYFLEYNGYLPPWREDEPHDLGSANIAYSRAILVKYQEFLSGGYWEAGLHPRLMADGVKFRSVPEMKVHHRGPFDYGYYLQQRYWFSRAFAGCRASQMPASKKLAYFVAAPFVPFLLLARMTKRVLDKHCRPGKFAQSVPLLLPALIVYVAGEFVGYMAGPGEALSKVE
ncbi:MAG TPA: glycosyltransferase [Bryobacteraceae bacterium]|jgi:glycosyltransferase involved in cell wall biosynthesis